MKYFIGVFFTVCTLVSAGPIDAQARLTPEQVVQFRQAALAARQNNYVLAVDIYETLAELDLVDAQYNLAFLFESGLGRPQNFKVGLYWAWLAQLGGEARAITLAETLNENVTEGVAKDVIGLLTARLTKQIESGRKDAILKLANLYYSILPDPDYINAYIWFAIGQAVGLPDAAQGGMAARKELDAEKLVEAQASASTMFDKLDYLSKAAKN